MALARKSTGPRRWERRHAESLQLGQNNLESLQNYVIGGEHIPKFDFLQARLSGIASHRGQREIRRFPVEWK
jgi:hypothetical protein